MAQIILIENNQSLHELLSINLTTYLGVELIPRESAADAINLMNILPAIDLVITRDKIGEEETARNIAKFIQEKSADTGLLVLGEVPEGATDMAVGITNPKEWEKVVQSAARILGINPELLSRKVIPDYVPIPVKYFLNLDTSCCDVFIRIKKGPDEFQFVKRIHDGDTFSKAVINRYVDQGLKLFYIPRDMQKNFANFLSDRLVTRLEESLDGSIEEQLEILGNSYNVATKEILKMGFTSATVQLTESIVESMIKTFEKNPQMSPLLRKVINSKNGYMYQHCHMTSIVSSEILNNLGITDKETHEKMGYASFFHDISMTEKEELAKITSFEELEKAELSEEDWDMVFNHALEASVLINKHPEAPKEVDLIIKQHHGALNGKGFSVTNATKLSGLSKIFFISCEFVKELLAFKEKGGRPTPIIDELYKKYPDKEMVKVIRALEKTLKRKQK